MDLLAQGRDCDIFDRGDGTVLRRSRKAYDQGPEARVLAYAAEHGYPVPSVQALADEGRDLIMEKVEGPTMVQALERRPWTARAVGRQLGDLHNRLHDIPGPNWLPRLPEGDALLHFDLHPQNVILSPRGPVVIDWTNACVGAPGVDIARAWALTACADTDVGGVIKLALTRVRRALVAGFVDTAGRDDARAGLAYAVELTLLDPHISPVEQDRMRALVAAEATSSG
jgi:aminoglycoside phosphotransferase (APT) family kinase protein